jgi:hypothetical protein
VKNKKKIKYIVYDCSRLQRIELCAFAGTSLTSIYLPNSLHFIHGSAFRRVFLEFVSFSPSEVEFCVQDDVIEDISGRTFVLYFGQSSLIAIPNRIEGIGEGCFDSIRSVSHVTFEAGSRLERIAEFAFSSTNIGPCFVVPRRVTILPRSCFECCISLKFVKLEPGSAIREIGPFAFAMSRLRRFGIPASVEEIGEEAFRWCGQLQSITFKCPSQVRQLKQSTFFRSGLKSVSIPASIETIGIAGNCSRSALE